MIIEMEKKKQYEFKKLGIGEVYISISCSDCYMKTKDLKIELTTNGEMVMVNSVNLLSGELVYCEEDTKVYTPPYSFKIIERGFIKE